jgi:single-stranded-DNA-specific exonuclease
MLLYESDRLTKHMLTPPLRCDAEVLLSDLTEAFVAWLTRCEPFGIGNPEPIFIARGLSLTAPVRFIKERHICLQLQRAGDTFRMSALGWSRAIQWPERCAEINLNQGSIIDAAFKLKAKTNPQYPGLELELVDIQLG